MPLGRGLHSASRLQEWSRKEDSKNFSLMFRHDGDVVNFLMQCTGYEFNSSEIVNDPM